MRSQRPGSAIDAWLGSVTCAETSAPSHNFEPPATREEIHDAALQYVRKISGSSKPSQANQEAFERAVEQVTRATAELLDGLVSSLRRRTARPRRRSGALGPSSASRPPERQPPGLRALSTRL